MAVLRCVNVSQDNKSCTHWKTRKAVFMTARGFSSMREKAMQYTSLVMMMWGRWCASKHWNVPEEAGVLNHGLYMYCICRENRIQLHKITNYDPENDTGDKSTTPFQFKQSYSFTNIITKWFVILGFIVQVLTFNFCPSNFSFSSSNKSHMMSLIHCLYPCLSSASSFSFLPSLHLYQLSPSSSLSDSRWETEWGCRSWSNNIRHFQCKDWVIVDK